MAKETIGDCYATADGSTDKDDSKSIEYSGAVPTPPQTTNDDDQEEDGRPKPPPSPPPLIFQKGKLASVWKVNLEDRNQITLHAVIGSHEVRTTKVEVRNFMSAPEIEMRNSEEETGQTRDECLGK